MYPVYFFLHKILYQEDVHRYAKYYEQGSISLVLISKYLDSEEKNITLQQMEKKKDSMSFQNLEICLKDIMKVNLTFGIILDLNCLAKIQCFKLGSDFLPVCLIITGT